MDSEGSAVPEAVGHVPVPRHRVCIVRQRDVYEPQIRRVAEALVGAGYDVDVLLMRRRDRPRTTVVNGVQVISLPGALGRSNKLRYAFDYASFTVLAALTLAFRHARRRYSVVQLYTMPDFLVFAALVPKLLGSRVIAYMNEPPPELFETLYGDDVIEYFEPDDATDLARAIRRLHDDPVRSKELAHNGRLAQERHGWGVQQKIYLGVYDALLKGGEGLRGRLSGRPSRAS